MRYRGHTLSEVLAVLAILAILAALAVPSLRGPLATAAVHGAANEALAGLALARRTALSTARTTVLCLTRDTWHCDSSGHEWMLFSKQANGTLDRRDAGEQLLRRWPLPRGVQISSTRTYAGYLPQTRAASTVTFTFCHPAALPATRSVIISQTGRPRISYLGRPNNPAPSRCP